MEFYCKLYVVYSLLLDGNKNLEIYFYLLVNMFFYNSCFDNVYKVSVICSLSLSEKSVLGICILGGCFDVIVMLL